MPKAPKHRTNSNLPQYAKRLLPPTTPMTAHKIIEELFADEDAAHRLAPPDYVWINHKTSASYEITSYATLEENCEVHVEYRAYDPASSPSQRRIKWLRPVTQFVRKFRKGQKHPAPPTMYTPAPALTPLILKPKRRKRQAEPRPPRSFKDPPIDHLDFHGEHPVESQ